MKNLTKKTLALVVAAGALSLTGCGMIPGTGDSTPSPSATSAAPTQSQSAEPTETETTEATPLEDTSSTPEASESAEATGAYDEYDFIKGEVSDDQFVTKVRGLTTTLTDVSDIAIVTIASKSCATLGNGGDDVFYKLMNDAAEKVTSSASIKGTDIELNSELGKDVGKLLGASVLNYCPQYKQNLIESVPAGSL